MVPSQALLNQIENIRRRHRRRYRPQAYLFVLAALHVTVGRLPEPRHITGRELLEGIRLYGLDQFGPLTAQVLAHWGVHTTEDFGEIVFHLVEAKLLGKTEEDSLEDFKGVYDFAAAFAPEPLYKLAEEG